METVIKKWGNSLAVRIPRALAAEARVADGAPVDVTVEDGALVLRPKPAPRVDLKSLLKGVTKRNLHAEVATGPRRGREA
jgi:antitoxin MazE